MIDVLTIRGVLGQLEPIELIKDRLNGVAQIICTLRRSLPRGKILCEVLPVIRVDNGPDLILERDDLGIYGTQPLKGLCLRDRGIADLLLTVLVALIRLLGIRSFCVLVLGYLTARELSLAARSKDS